MKIWNFRNDCCAINCEAPIKLFVIFDSRYKSATINYLHRPWGVLSLQKSDSAMLCPSRSFIISLNSDRNENLWTVRDFCTWQWDNSATLHTGLANCTPQEDHIICEGLKWGPPLCTHLLWSGRGVGLPTRKLFTNVTVKLRNNLVGSGFKSRLHH